MDGPDSPADGMVDTALLRAVDILGALFPATDRGSIENIVRNTYQRLAQYAVPSGSSNVGPVLP